MASKLYGDIQSAIQRKQQVIATYSNHRREMCPHAIGVGRRDVDDIRERRRPVLPTGTRSTRFAMNMTRRSVMNSRPPTSLRAPC